MRTMSSVLPANYYLLLLCIVVLMLGENDSSAFVTTVKQPIQRQNKYVLYYLPNHNYNDNEHELELEQDLVYFDIMRRTTNNHNYNSNSNIANSKSSNSNNELGENDDMHPLDRACQELMMEEEQNRARARSRGDGSFEDDLTSQIKMWKDWKGHQGQDDGFY